MKITSQRKPEFPHLAKWTGRLISLSIFALIWELFARSTNSLLLPTFTQTASALAHLLVTPELWDALWISNQAMILGFSCAAIIGIMLGFIMGRWHIAEKVIDPYLNILLVTPMSALVPILIMATGLGMVSRVLVVFIFSVLVIVVNVRAGLKNIDASWIEMAHSFGISEWQLWSKILFPGALPSIMTGLRLGIARAITGMLMVELLLLALGMGRMILNFQSTFESASLYATVLVIVAEAVLLMRWFRWLEHRVSPWAEQAVVE
jgi:NitT/TauT family transport system permease protein